MTVNHWVVGSSPARGAIIHDYLQTLQSKICSILEQEEPAARFQKNTWTRPLGGGGQMALLEGGAVFEKAGVNVSHVFGDSLPSSATEARPHVSGASFEATGLSLVLHPQNPFVPTTHLNLRYFTAIQKGQDPIWWFGGGFDLTPYYGFIEDCKHWHLTAKKACDPFGPEVYARFKAWCDRYFYLKHRQEPRGIGGIFFDDLNHWPWEQCFDFIKRVGEAFLEAYLPILKKRKNLPYTEHHKAFQHYRRGRYVEFNLVYDRGTLFGLQSGGHTEAILMSLPPKASWHLHPKWRQDEEVLCRVFLKSQDWVAE